MQTEAYNLLCRLNKASDCVQDESECLAEISRIQDWSQFWTLASANACTALVKQRLLSLSQAHPQVPKISWDIEQRDLKRYAAANKALSELNQAGIQVVLLKGAMLGECVYKNPYYKKMSDWDLLIPKDQIPNAVSVLRQLKFQSLGNVFGAHEFSDSNHHLAPYLSEDGTCILSLHWKICSPWAKYRANAKEYFASLVPMTLRGGASAYRMSWEHNLLHLCIHLPFLKIGIRELADISNLLLHCRDELDWQVFFAKVQEWKAQAAVYRALTLANKVIPFPHPDAQLSQLRTYCSRFEREDTEIRSSSLGILLNTRCDLIGKIEKAFLLFRLSKNYSERKEAIALQWRSVLWPPQSEVKKIFPNEKAPSWRAMLGLRVLAPIRIWRVMARDFGHRGLLIMTLVNLGDFLLASLRRPFVSDGKSFFREERFSKITDFQEKYVS